MRNLLVSLAAAGLLAAALPAAADALVDVSIIDRASNAPLFKYEHRGRTYVAGEPGRQYAVRLRNRTGRRVLAVLSVDGVNAVTGETASPGQRGYVLDPHESAEIAGWRKSEDDIAQFYFTRLSDSYAARTDRPENVGVIGVAAFRERVPLPPPDMHFDRYYVPEAARSAAPAAKSSPPSTASTGVKGMESRAAEPRERIGTGHGSREYSPIEHTTFERATGAPAQIVAIRYDSPDNLRAMGIVPHPAPARRNEPQPFPGQYVPDPTR